VSTPIVIVEPNAILRESLRHFLEHNGFTIAGTFDSARSVARVVDASEEATIVLNGTRCDILADFTLLKALWCKAHLVVYGGRSELDATLEAIRSGATVYLDDKAHALMFLNSLELAAHGSVTMSIAWHDDSVQAANREDLDRPKKAIALTSDQPERLFARGQVTDLASEPDQIERALTPSFSPRESAILQLLREGAPNKLIARKLSLTEATVKVHLKSILRKIRVNNRTQAAVWAMGHEEILRASW
jgi:two-component system nitrate/nitrite response regulator NarL